MARFPNDNQVYRAKVTAHRKGPDCQISYDVLYLDYGNSSKDLKDQDLWRWDAAYEMIQPQAYLCSFKDFPVVRKMKTDLFQKIMASQGAMKIEISQVFPSKCGFFKGSDKDFGKNVELLVSLTTKAGKDVCEVLAASSSILGQNPSVSSSLRGKKTASQDQVLLRSLNVPPGKLVSAPPPLHLPGGLAHLPNPPLSPILPETMVQSIQKVSNWDCSDWDCLISQASDEKEVLVSEENDQEEEELARQTESEGREVSSN